MNPNISTELLDRFLNDRCTAEEITVVNQWINSFEDDDDYISAVSDEQALLIKNKIRDNILAKIAGSQDNVVPLINLPGRKIRKMVFGWRWAAAASVLLLAFLSVYYLREKHAISTVIADQQLTFVNKENTIYKLALPDNSHVWLNPKSSVTYPTHFLSAYRLIKMNGECFFEVVKGAKWPFIIQSKHLVTKVWGTSFRIRDNASLNYADVSVVTGKVSVSPNHGGYHNLNKLNAGEVMIYPAEKATLPAAGNEIAKQTQTGTEGMKIWNKMSLTFEQTSVKKMIPLLEKQFNVEILVNDPTIMDEELNADFDNFNLADILTVFEKTLNIKYTIVNNTVTLSR